MEAWEFTNNIRAHEKSTVNLEMISMEYWTDHYRKLLQDDRLQYRLHSNRNTNKGWKNDNRKNIIGEAIKQLKSFCRTVFKS